MFKNRVFEVRVKKEQDATQYELVPASKKEEDIFKRAVDDLTDASKELVLFGAKLAIAYMAADTIRKVAIAYATK